MILFEGNADSRDLILPSDQSILFIDDSGSIYFDLLTNFSCLYRISGKGGAHVRIQPYNMHRTEGESLEDNQGGT